MSKLNKLEVVIRDKTEVGRRPLLHDLFFKNSPRSVEYCWVLSKISSASQRILDVGCKGTMFPILLANLGHKVTGIDMKIYDEKHPNFKFVQGDILEKSTKEKLQGQEFDVITLVPTLEHVGILGRASENLNLEADVQTLKYLGHELLSKDGNILATVPMEPLKL